jgi:hypothetical protein
MAAVVPVREASAAVLATIVAARSTVLIMAAPEAVTP